MKEYIERDAALQGMWNALYALEDQREKHHGLDWFERKNLQDGFEAGQRVIANLPAADVVEVRHGENIGEDYDAVDQFVCSKCGIELQGWYMVERDMDDGEETHHEYVMRYCPNCGAKMDGGVNDGGNP